MSPTEDLPPEAHLSEEQRRHLGSILRRVERAAWHVEEQMRQETPPDLVLTQFTHPPGTLQLGTLLRLARTLREKVAQLAFAYGIEAEEEPYLHSLHDLFIGLQADLEEVQPDVLGQTPQTQTRLEDVIELVLALDGVASGTQDARHTLQALEKAEDDQMQAERSLNELNHPFNRRSDQR